MASNFLENTSDWEIIILKGTQEGGIVLFLIQIRIGKVKWNIVHRYNDFSELHKILVCNHSVSKELLPPKTFLKTKSEQFIEVRRKGLESYINSVFSFLSKTMPPDLVSFLEMDKYDMWFLFRTLAKLIRQNNWINNPPKEFQMKAIEVCALSERLKLPCPPVGVIGSQTDFCTILEFCTSLKEIVIIGESKEYFGTSNIKYREMPFELSSFKSLKNISFLNMCMANLINADDARTVIQFLKANYCNLKTISDILLCDKIHKDWNQSTSGQMWKLLKNVDLSYNSISEVDSGLELMTQLTDLNLSFNHIKDLHNIVKLQHLNVLRVSHNNISLIEDKNIYLPSLKYLDISYNKITHINGIIQFPALETLNISFNLIDNFDELNYACKLPSILNIDLIGNPISQKTDYRVKVLEKFGKRKSLLCLDNEQSTTRELELISMMQAIRFVQEGRAPSYNKNLSLDI